MKPYLEVIQYIGLIVPQRLQDDWRQEWEAEMRYCETLLAQWDRLAWRSKLDLCRRSGGALRGCWRVGLRRGARRGLIQ